ncbi:MAG: hypothetical protein DKT66_00855 [Candidatus Melainabacteria bacterium]|nr:MAG: hypothetical protein DKT66_00855 [Candidatus Melainabacteria bacterium]
MDGNLDGLRASAFGVSSLVSLAFAQLIAITPASATDPQPPANIVSLAPSNTELMLDIGARKSLAGICTNCPQVLPNADQVLKGVPIAGTFVSANLERMMRLKPDFILVVSGQEAIAHTLSARGFKVKSLSNNTLSDIPNNLRQIGKFCKKEKRGAEVALDFETAVSQLKALIKSTKTRPKVFYCTWAQPLLTVGQNSFLNDVITTCGGTNIAANIQQPYPHFSAERLIMADPDVIVLPYDAKEQQLFKRFPWNKLRAVRENRLFYSPDPKDDMLSRPSFRVLDGLYWLSLKIHPQLKPKLDEWHRNMRMSRAKY